MLGCNEVRSYPSGRQLPGCEGLELKIACGQQDMGTYTKRNGLAVFICVPLLLLLGLLNGGVHSLPELLSRCCKGVKSRHTIVSVRQYGCKRIKSHSTIHNFVWGFSCTAVWGGVHI